MRTLLIILFLFLSSSLNAEGKYFIGSSAFVLANLDSSTDIPPNFYQLNFGVKLDDQQTLSVEFITWRYYSPLGIPLGEGKLKDSNRFPGYVKAKGIGIAYQNFFKDKFFSALHVQWMQQDYIDNSDNKLGSGEQIFMTLRLGYQFRFFSGRVFLEPNLAITYWPVNTNLPSSFQAEEDRWPNYFAPEPGLHIGYSF
ncbi:MAG: hypothetical protein AB8E15_10020 [Bdellovibrionales bacterium]